MESNYKPVEALDKVTFIEGRDDRAKFAYHHGAFLARKVLDRLLPTLSKEDGTWLYDQIFELHLALYSATLFEVHLAADGDIYAGDDSYSNGLPVVWRESNAGLNQRQPLYEGIGEHFPEDGVWMVSPPALAYAPTDGCVEQLGSRSPEEAPSVEWKLPLDMYLDGLLTIADDDMGRIAKIQDVGPLRPNWIFNTEGFDYHPTSAQPDN